MRINPVAWFAQMWPFDSGRRAVLADYAAVGAQHKHFLTDVALRGGVYGDGHDDASLYQAGKFEGRRELALELIKLCKVDPDQLFALIPKKPRGDDR